MQQLPQDVLERILLFVGIPAEIARNGSLCQNFYRAANVPHVWQKLSRIKFGEEIAAKSLPLYQDNWKRLLIDDNKLGALPVLSVERCCMYAYNRYLYYFCCLVKCVQWDRSNHELRVFIDVRGETDLRHPMGSSLVLRNDTGGVLVQPSRGFQPTLNLNPTGYEEDIPSTSRHFKGHLKFPAPTLPGMYTFCYANYYQHQRTDYLPISLLEIPKGPLGLQGAFLVGESNAITYTFRASPFADDTPEKERARWEAVVPEEVMKRGVDRIPGRNTGLDPWYV